MRNGIPQKLVGSGKYLTPSRLVSLGGAKQDVPRNLPVPMCFSEWRIPGKGGIGRRSDGESTTYHQGNATKVGSGEERYHCGCVFLCAHMRACKLTQITEAWNPLAEASFKFAKLFVSFFYFFCYVRFPKEMMRLIFL